MAQQTSDLSKGIVDNSDVAFVEVGTDGLGVLLSATKSVVALIPILHCICTVGHGMEFGFLCV